MAPTEDRGFTLVELLIVVAIISVLAAITVPVLLRARMTSNETSALATMKVINSSQISYWSSCGNGGYAPSLAVLATPAPTAGFISAEMSTDPTFKSGYQFNIANGTPGGPGGAGPGPLDCNGSATQDGYYAAGQPLQYGVTGSRSFATDAGNVVYQVWSPLAPSGPPWGPAIPIG